MNQNNESDKKKPWTLPIILIMIGFVCIIVSFLPLTKEIGFDRLFQLLGILHLFGSIVLFVYYSKKAN